jgi:hypothetical protein
LTSQDFDSPADRYLKTTKAVNLLKRIQRTLNKTISVWETFATYGIGDIDFFVASGSYSNSESEEHVHRLLSSIKDTYKTLEERRKVLLELQDTCQESRKDVRPKSGFEMFYEIDVANKSSLSYIWFWRAIIWF